MIPLIGLLIKLNSAGPIIIRQVYTGLKGQIIHVLKFRTMHYNTFPTVFQQAGYHDPRVTSIGRFLRTTSLDAMPQFINVLLGYMSVVGPRPHPIQLDSELFAYIPDYYQRYSVKPGIIGLAQVRVRRVIFGDVLNTKHILKYDFFYIKNWSFGLDLKLIYWQLKNSIVGDKNSW